ncbi:FAD/NAD(P)-binding protein [soil metagenome]
MKCNDSTLEWMVIGGGIHGSYLTNCLIRKRFTKRSDIRVIDPHDQPLAQWKRVTANTGMKYLRSPKVHHLDMEPFALKHFARSSYCEDDLFIAPNERPSLDLFNRHADAVVEKSGLRDLFIKNRAVHIEKEGEKYLVRTGSDIFKAYHILLSVGMADQPEWPAWADSLRRDGIKIDHVLDVNYSMNSIPDVGEIVVVGGGMSAFQTALSLVNDRRRITVLSSHSLQIDNYDSDPGWMGPKYLKRYRTITCPNRRRRVINQVRNSGSITQDLHRGFNLEIKRGRCRFLVDRIKHAAAQTHDLILMETATAEKIAANSIILATGYEKKRPGGELIDQLISHYNLKCAACGFPITSTELQWSERLFVTGALGELEIGPAARNLVGARMTENKIRNFVMRN